MIDNFSKIIGKNNIITPDDSRAKTYLTDWCNIYHSNCLAILRPKDTTEIQKIVKLCGDNNIKIIPVGGNTGHVGGTTTPPEQSHNTIMLSLERLNKIIELDTDNATLTLESGCILEHAQKAAEEANLRLPLNLGARGSCQIGGNISTNAGGVLTIKYGNMRSLVLGLEVVLPNGEVWHGLKKLQKDNSGYDLKQLFIGAEGTLGIITKATIQLQPQPQEITAFMSGCNTAKQAFNLFKYLKNKLGEHIYAAEIIPALGMEFALLADENCKAPFETKYEWNLLIGVESMQKGWLSNAIEEILEKAFENNLLEDAAIPNSLQQEQNLWNIRESMVLGQEFAPARIKHDISVAPSLIPILIKKTDRLIKAEIPHGKPMPFGHIGDGNLHYNIILPDNYNSKEEIADFHKKGEILTQKMHELTTKLNGSFAAEHGVGITKNQEMLRLKPPTDIELLKSIKNSLDPKGIMSPTKILP